MLATVEEFRAMVPGAGARMTDEQITQFILNLERFFRGLDKIAMDRSRAKALAELEVTRAKRAKKKSGGRA